MKDIDTESNSTVASDRDFGLLTVAEKNEVFYQQMIARQPVTVNGLMLCRQSV